MKHLHAWLARGLAGLVVLVGAVGAVGVAGVVGVARGQDGPPAASSFTVVLDPSVFEGPYTGRIYVGFGREGSEPRRRLWDWFEKTQVVAVDVVMAGPGSAVVVKAPALSWPKAWAEIPPKAYAVQAVARRSLDGSTPGVSPGDVYSEAVSVTLEPGGSAPAAELRLTRTAEARPFRETERVKLFEVKSPSLSGFLGRERAIRAGVVLPKGWAEGSGKKWPVIYWIGGFGSDHRSAAGVSRLFGDEVLVVVPDPSCLRGHSVFADSENNGPWGKALVEELIPAVEAKYGGDPARRYVSGMSSGGWSSLWLQVAYPDTFDGCWSHCPDPVDFRDFQRVNLYESGSNIYKDGAGARRPVARQGETPSLYFDDFIAQETVMGPGGQIHSFEAVFSPKGKDGQPRPMFDRATGAVDLEVAKTWEKYDIRLKLEREWARLGPKLKGKLHIYAGGMDTFYLDGAAKLLKESLEKLGSDAEVVIVPGMPHTIHRPGIEAMLKTATGAGGPEAR